MEGREDATVQNTGSDDEEKEDIDARIEAMHLPPLLSLPLEILQLVQLHMDVGTFFTSLLTCKRFFYAASSRPLVFRHLQDMPGLGLGLDALDNDELLSVFRKRAAESGRAAGVLAHIHTYIAPAGCLMSKSAFTPHDPFHPRSTRLTLAVPRSSGTVQLYELHKDHIWKTEELHIRPEDDNPNRMDILKMAFAPGSRDLAILCYQKESLDYRQCSPSVLERLRDQVVYYKLIVFHRLHARQKGHFYSSHVQDTRDVAVRRNLKIVALALASNGTACVSLHDGRPDACLNAWLIKRGSNLNQISTYDPNPRMSRVDGFMSDSLIFNLQFAEEGRKLEFFEAGHHIPKFYSCINDSGEQESRIVLQTGHAISLHQDGRRNSFSIGAPFYEHHLRGQNVDLSSEPRCVRSQLALGFTENKKDPTYPKHSVFIMKARYHTLEQDCSHAITYDSGRSANRTWRPIALLAGYKQGNSTLGTVAAISPEGTRIAAAIWNRVYLWSFNPRLMLEGELHLYFPPHDFNERKGFGRIRPSSLRPAGGIVHSMIWLSEEHLFGITVRRSMKSGSYS